ncbi:MAG: hypothetical protein AAF267_24570, partial [Deinococcota bacterium]
LAHHFAAGITEVDDIHTVLMTLTSPEQQPELHYWDTKPASVEMTAEDILNLHISVARAISPALQAVIANHVETHTPIVLEGDYILPELLVNPDVMKYANRIRAVFLYEPDKQQLVNNFLAREPDEGEQVGRAHVSQLYGDWLQNECSKYGLPALSARPWENLFERILATFM